MKLLLTLLIEGACLFGENDMNKLLLRICTVLMIIAVAVSTLACNKKNNVDETAAFSGELLRFSYVLVQYS